MCGNIAKLVSNKGKPPTSGSVVKLKALEYVQRVWGGGNSNEFRHFRSPIFSPAASISGTHYGYTDPPVTGSDPGVNRHPATRRRPNNCPARRKTSWLFDKQPERTDRAPAELQIRPRRLSLSDGRASQVASNSAPFQHSPVRV